MMKKLSYFLMIVLGSITVHAYAASPEHWVSLSLENLPTDLEIGQTYNNVVLRVTNPNTQTILLNQLLNPKYPAGFTVNTGGDTCVNKTLASTQSCTVTGTFKPAAFENVWQTQVVVEGLGWDEVYSAKAYANALKVDATASNQKLISFNGVADTGSITVTNQSNEALSLSAALAQSITGFTLYANTCTDTLAAGASCTYGVSYTSPTNATNTNIARSLAQVIFTYGNTNKTNTLNDYLNLDAVKKGAFISLPTFKAGSSLASDVINDVVVQNGGADLYVATDAGLNISHDYGATYKTYTTNDGLGANNIGSLAVSTDGQTIILATPNGLTISTDGGHTYINKDISPSNAGSTAIQSVAYVGNKIYATITGGALRVSSDNGTSFSSLPTVDNAANLAVSANGKVIVVSTSTENHEIYISNDGGQTFQSRSTAVGLPSLLIESEVSLSADGQIIYLVTASNQVYKSTNAGVSFTAVSMPTVVDPLNVTVSPDATKVFVAAVNGVGISTDSGATFSFKPVTTLNVISYVTGVQYDDTTDKLYADTMFGLSTLASGASDFVNQQTSQGLTSGTTFGMMFDPTHAKLYVATEGGNVDVSTDDGNTFTTPSSSLKDYAITRMAQTSNGQYAYFLGFNASQDILYYSADGGVTTQPITSLCDTSGAVYRDVYINPVTGKVYILMSVSNKPVIAMMSADTSNKVCLSTTNSGLPDLPFTKIAASNDDNNLFVSSNTQLMLSTNNGQTFVDKTSGLFPAVIRGLSPGVNNQSLYVSTSQGLQYTANNGASYSQIAGLANDNIVSSQFANNGQTWLIATAGGLSVSQDGGATFTNYTAANGLTLPVIKGLQTADGKGLFVVTEQGLYYTLK